MDSIFLFLRSQKTTEAVSILTVIECMTAFIMQVLHKKKLLNEILGQKVKTHEKWRLRNVAVIVKSKIKNTQLKQQTFC